MASPQNAWNDHCDSLAKSRKQNPLPGQKLGMLHPVSEIARFYPNIPYSVFVDRRGVVYSFGSTGQLRNLGPKS